MYIVVHYRSETQKADLVAQVSFLALRDTKEGGSQFNAILPDLVRLCFKVIIVITSIIIIVIIITNNNNDDDWEAQN